MSKEDPSPMPDEFLYLQKVSEILRSRHTGVAEALKSNIVQFHTMVRTTEELQALKAQQARDHTEMKEEMEHLRRELKRQKNFENGSAENHTAHTGSDDT